jgi:hypothetical protein
MVQESRDIPDAFYTVPVQLCLTTDDAQEMMPAMFEARTQSAAWNRTEPSSYATSYAAVMSIAIAAGTAACALVLSVQMNGALPL